MRSGVWRTADGRRSPDCTSSGSAGIGGALGCFAAQDRSVVCSRREDGGPCGIGAELGKPAQRPGSALQTVSKTGPHLRVLARKSEEVESRLNLLIRGAKRRIGVRRRLVTPVQRFRVRFPCAAATTFLIYLPFSSDAVLLFPISPRTRSSSSRRIALSLAAGLRCMYRCMVVRLTCPASSWIAFAVAPRIASPEQNVCRRMCSRPVICRRSGGHGGSTSGVTRNHRVRRTF